MGAPFLLHRKVRKFLLTGTHYTRIRDLLRDWVACGKCVVPHTNRSFHSLQTAVKMLVAERGGTPVYMFVKTALESQQHLGRELTAAEKMAVSQALKQERNNRTIYVDVGPAPDLEPDPRLPRCVMTKAQVEEERKKLISKYAQKTERKRSPPKKHLTFALPCIEEASQETDTSAY